MEKPNLITENSHEELYALLCEAEFKFSRAIQTDTLAGRTIFETTLDALTQYKWGGNLPIIDQYPYHPTDASILPPPVLVGLAHCLDCAQTVCLEHLGLTSGQRHFDRKILPWPKTLLRGLQSKIRFFIDMTEVYKRYQNENPLLSDPETRAIQLLVIGRHLIEIHKHKIGQPLRPQIYRV